MRKKVMIVEDNELNLKLFTDLLRAHQFTVEGVRDGRHACLHSDTEIRGPEEEFRLQGGPRGRWLLQSRLHMGMMLESEGISAAACSSQ